MIGVAAEGEGEGERLEFLLHHSSYAPVGVQLGWNKRQHQNNVNTIIIRLFTAPHLESLERWLKHNNMLIPITHTRTRTHYKYMDFWWQASKMRTKKT